MIKEEHSVLVDENTGEIYREELKQNYSKLWKDGKGYMLKHRNYHIKYYEDVYLSDIITDNGDLFKTYRLVEYIFKNTNVIYNRKHGRIRSPAQIEDIAEILSISVKRARAYMTRMKDMGIIAEITLEIHKMKYKSYVFNPVYVNSCKYISNELYILFKPYLDSCIPNWAKMKYLEWSNDVQRLEQ